MSETSKRMLSAAAAASTPGAVYVDDVFTPHLYIGDQTSPRTITTNLDLATDGGLVWVRCRDAAADHILFDTVTTLPDTGSNKTILKTNDMNTLFSDVYIKSITTTGFTTGANSNVNGNLSYVSYSFKQHDTFFKIVRYTGDGSASGFQTINHGLGATPRFIAIKRTDQSSEWMCYIPYGQNLNFNTTDSSAGSQRNKGYIDTVTSTSFTVREGSTDADYVNESGGEYTAYVFGGIANEQSFGENQDQDIIRVGNYTGSGSQTTGPVQNLGWEPEFILVKAYNNTGNWYIFDTARQDMSYKSEFFSTQNDNPLAANLGGTEIYNEDGFVTTPTGFRPIGTSTTNVSGNSFFYMAIRRPMKPPTSTNVFSIDINNNSGTGYNPEFSSNLPVDFSFFKNATVSSDWGTGLRYLRKQYLNTNSNAPENNNANYEFDYQNGWYSGVLTSSNIFIGYMWTRASKFFDVASYRGTSSAQNITHNLNAAPEMMLVKKLNGAADWYTYHSSLGPTKYGVFNSSSSVVTSNVAWNDTAPTDSVFTVGTSGAINNLNDEFVALLFASRNGISKIGSYTGTGSAQNIECDFSNGAKFIMIKNYSSTVSNPWYLFDTTQGISVSSSPYLKPGSTSNQNDGGNAPNWIVPYSGGFGVAAGTTNVNTNGETYSFYAIAT